MYGPMHLEIIYMIHSTTLQLKRCDKTYAFISPRWEVNLPPPPPPPLIAHSFFQVSFSPLQYAKRPISKLTLHHMLEAGRDAWFDHSKILENAHFACKEVSKENEQEKLIRRSHLPYFFFLQILIN